MKDHTPRLTPIQKVAGGIYLKRDDLYCRAGIRGGKVRACWHLATTARPAGPALGLITASSRRSPQAQIVARLAANLGIPARCHMPRGKQTEEMQDMVAHGGELVQHKAGYNNVIIARAKEDHEERPGWRYIPFGMEHPEAIKCTRGQVRKIPKKVKRIVVCIGSGMSAAGILHGLRDLDLNIPVLGVRVGANPQKRLDTFGPVWWNQSMEIVTSPHAYEDAVQMSIGGVVLDPHYESKCVEFVRRYDLFWVVGIRATAATA